MRPGEGITSTAYAELAATPVTDDVAESIAKITPDTVGKLLFTSGSTGMPKAVINTQEMMCANAAMMMQVRPRETAGPIPTVLDWMPWNHTMGGNAAFNPVLVDGGTLYIDDGRPMPGQLEETIRNLRGYRRPITRMCRRAMRRWRPRWRRTRRCAEFLQEPLDHGLWRRPAARRSL